MATTRFAHCHGDRALRAIERLFRLVDGRQVQGAAHPALGREASSTPVRRTGSSIRSRSLSSTWRCSCSALSCLCLQPIAPLNPLGRGMLAPSTIFNTVISFMTNTNLQHYSGDQHLSNFSQIFFILPNMFLSASVGFCALDGDHPRLSRRYARRQLLRRYVARRGLHVLPAALDLRHHLHAAGHADDLSTAPRSHDARARRDGHSTTRARPSSRPSWSDRSRPSSRSRCSAPTAAASTA